MNVGDITIPAYGERIGPECVVLWYLTGVPHRYYPTKIAAEAAAREHFPHEDIDQRYGRIFYREFFREVS